MPIVQRVIQYECSINVARRSELIGLRGQRFHTVSGPGSTTGQYGTLIWPGCHM